jgi:hypothetical protein
MNKANDLASRTPEIIGRVVKRLATSWLIGLVFVVLLAAYFIKIMTVNVINRAVGRYKRRHHKLPTQTLMRNRSLVSAAPVKHTISSYKIEHNPDYCEILSIMQTVQTQKRLPDDLIAPISTD